MNPNKMKLVTLSEFQKQELQKTYPKVQAEVISFGIEKNNTEKDDIEKKSFFIERNIDLLNVGSLNQIKNICLVF